MILKNMQHRLTGRLTVEWQEFGSKGRSMCYRPSLETEENQEIPQKEEQMQQQSFEVNTSWI